MDPLFERRDLVRKVHLISKSVQKNIQGALLAQLKQHFEGRCSSEGFIQGGSLVILSNSLGRLNYRKGGTDYDVKFQADICLPHAGQTFKAVVSLRSKIGIHADCEPLKVLIPRDLHIGNAEFEGVELKQEIEFEVVGAEFKQEDRNIYVVGRLRSAVKAGPLMPLLSVDPKEDIEVSRSGDGDSEQKTVTINPTATEAPKKRKLKRKEPVDINEQTTEGTSKGTD
jgi:DNA-directed RNA polymerase subunit E'/Rpb7